MVFGDMCMTEMEGSDVERQFHRKFNSARKAVYAADWTPDKAFKIQGNMVPYVSIAKMKRNIAPALLKSGIDFTVEFSDLVQRTVGTSTTYWSVTCKVSFFDEDTGYGMSTAAIGGYAGTDKGITICQTFALKQALSSVFLIIDGIEPMDDVTTGTYHAKTEEEIEEVKSNILNNKDVIKPTETVNETPNEAPKEEKKVSLNIKNVDVDAPVETPSDKPAVPQSKGVELPKTVSGFELMGPQRNIVAKILANWETAAKEGKTNPENYNRMSADYATMASTKDAMAFIRTYKVVF